MLVRNVKILKVFPKNHVHYASNWLQHLQCHLYPVIFLLVTKNRLVLSYRTVFYYLIMDFHVCSIVDNRQIEFSCNLQKSNNTLRLLTCKVLSNARPLTMRSLGHVPSSSYPVAPAPLSVILKEVFSRNVRGLITRHFFRVLRISNFKNIF